MRFSEMSAADIGREINSGRADPISVAEAFLDAINGYAASEEIYARITPDRALKEAGEARKRAQSGTRKGPFDGVPVSWKDLYDTKDVGTESGAALLKGRVPDKDAVVLKNATDAGSVCIGKTHQTEFAFSGLGLNPNTATPPNLSMPGHAPGGSSSGAAASVACGLAPIAIGSDTGGSVRIPAAWNSLVGMKTTHGLLSLENVLALCSVFDTVGPLAKSVEDAALMIEMMGGCNTDLAARPKPSDLRFAIVEIMALEGCDTVQMAAFDQTVANLTKAGVKIERISAPEFSNASKLGPELFPHEAWQSWGELIEANPGKTYGPVEKRFLQGKHVSKEQYDNAWGALRKIRSSFFDRISGFDGVLMPTVPIQPPLVEALLADEELFTSANLLALRNTRFVNLLGSCAITLPTATYAAGLQIMGKPNEDSRVMQIGCALENIASA